MKIISQFKDYYDCMQSVGGYDDSIMYQRNTENIELEQGDIHYKRKKEPEKAYKYYEDMPSKISRSIKGKIYHGGTYRLIPICVIFCGKVYYGYYENSTGTYGEDLYVDPNCPDFIYSKEAVEATMTRAGLKYTEDSDFTFSVFGWRSPEFSEKNINELFKKQGHDTDPEIHIRFNSPIIVIGVPNWDELNKKSVTQKDPNLSKIQFYKVIEPYTAYQELSMFVGGILNQPENPMVTISDETRQEKHGFDKWSFRKKGDQRGRKQRKRNRKRK